MPALNSRQVAIAYALLSAHSTVSARRLGTQLGLSARVVRYNLPMIAFWLSSRGANLSTTEREGIHLEAGEEVRAGLLRELQGSAPQRLLLSPHERRQLLLFELLTSWSYRTKQSLQKKLAISSSTLYRDLAEVESWCAENQLYLERRPRLGLQIIGREEDQRQATITLVLDFDLAGPLLDYCLSEAPVAAQHGAPRLSAAQRVIMDEVLRWQPGEAWRDVGAILRLLDVPHADFVQLTLALYWAITRRRLAQGCTVQLRHNQVEDLRGRREYLAISQHLSSRTGGELSLPAAEIAQLALLIAASLSGDSMPASLPIPDVEAAARKIAQRLACGIEPRIGTSPVTADVVARLEAHLARSITRLRHGLPIHNPLDREVQQAYPELWQSVKAVLDEEDLAGLLPEDEIAFITMYMALAQRLLIKSKPALRVIIACPTGGITVQMLVYRIGEELPEVEIVDVIPISHLGSVDHQTADAVISTASLSASPLPVITVSPLLNQQDLALLRRQLNLAH